MSNRKYINSENFHGVRTQTGGKTWEPYITIAKGFPALIERFGVRKYLPVCQKEEDAAHLRDLGVYGITLIDGNFTDTHPHPQVEHRFTAEAKARVAELGLDDWLEAVRAEREAADRAAEIAAAAAAAKKATSKALECRADGCENAFTNKRSKLCEVHIKCDSFLLDGVEVRSCSGHHCKPHPISEFDGTARYCRAAAEKQRNNRARNRPASAASGEAPSGRGRSTSRAAPGRRGTGGGRRTASAPARTNPTQEEDSQPHEIYWWSASSDDEYLSEYDSDAEAGGAASRSPPPFSSFLTAEEEADTIMWLKQQGFDVPFLSNQEDPPDDPHGVLEHLASDKWFIPPENKEAQQLWRSELRRALENFEKDSWHIAEQVAERMKYMHPEKFKINGVYPEDRRVWLRRYGFIDENDAFVKMIPPPSKWSTLERVNEDPPGYKRINPLRILGFKVPLEEDPDYEKQPHPFFKATKEPGLEKMYFPHGWLALKSYGQYHAHEKRVELERRIQPWVTRKEAFLDDNGVPSLDKIRAAYRDLGDLTDDLIQNLYEEPEFQDFIVENMAVLRVICQNEEKTPFLDALEKVLTEEDPEAVAEAKAAANAPAHVQDYISNPTFMMDPGTEEDWDDLAAVSAALKAKLDQKAHTPAQLEAAAAAMAAAAGGALPQPSLLCLEEAYKDLPYSQGSDAVLTAMGIAPVDNPVPAAQQKASADVTDPGPSTSAAAAAAAPPPSEPSIQDQIRQKLHGLNPELFKSATATLAKLTAAEEAHGSASAMAQAYIDGDNGQSFSFDEVQVMHEVLEAAQGASVFVDASADAAEGTAAAAAAAAATVGRLCLEDFINRWDVLEPGLSQQYIYTTQGYGGWEYIDGVLEKERNKIEAAMADAMSKFPDLEASLEKTIEEQRLLQRIEEWNWKVELAVKQNYGAWLEDILGEGWEAIIAAHPDGKVFGEHRRPPELFDPFLLHGVYDDDLNHGVPRCVFMDKLFSTSMDMAELGGLGILEDIWRYWSPCLCDPAVASRCPVPNVPCVAAEDAKPKAVAPEDLTEEDQAHIEDAVEKMKRAGKRRRKDVFYL